MGITASGDVGIERFRNTSNLIATINAAHSAMAF
ncbi:Uncharacterised protein [Vibrio cholerae]|uniref:Uncharacterized protein n=1 Tax=Vibrio cholerae TaxID=666 RepID=A0A655YI64_VIBCL|nr:Uncharacterised protein [Vibrio cholerae]CSI20399.1 Uncharacterised protein [Vibrio cholerae]CSI82975.1 Uncharacterised protein [Vibrio cholerae]